MPIERIHIAREVYSGKLKEILDLARERGVPIRREERLILDRMAEDASHQGIIAVCGALSYADFDVLFKADKPLVVALDGGEHPGLRRLVRENCDALVRLPMLGKIASLNISVAASVVLYEVVRQRRGGTGQ